MPCYAVVFTVPGAIYAVPGSIGMLPTSTAYGQGGVAYTAYMPRRQPGDGQKTVITEEIEAIRKERMGEAVAPPSGVIANARSIYKLFRIAVHACILIEAHCSNTCLLN